MTTVIKGGRIITSSQDFVGDILIDDGKIVAVGVLGGVGDGVSDVEVIDATGKLVFPGAVDPHTHMDIPHMDTVSSDDFFSGTAAAAVGGTTTIIDFPIQDKGQDPRHSLDRWFDKARGKAAVDWGFHQIITDLKDDYIPALSDMVGQGVTSFKFFMAYPGVWMSDDGAIFKALRSTSDSGALVMMHCENGLAIDVLVKQALANGEVEPIYHARTRPSTAEGEATSRAIDLAEMAGAPIYIVHLSCTEALGAVRRAQDRGLPVYAETCPQYLLLDEAHLAEPHFQGAKYVCSPPLREQSHLESLWGGLANGSLSAISTDHASFCMHGQKDRGANDFSRIPNGMPGVEWRVALIYHFGVGQGRISLNRFVDLVATSPAKLFGLYPRKGDILPGGDADIVVFDPDKEVTLGVASQLTRCDYNPYEGTTVRGWPQTVLLRGEVVARDGDFVGHQGQGSFLPSGPSSA